MIELAGFHTRLHTTAIACFGPPYLNMLQMLVTVYSIIMTMKPTKRCTVPPCFIMPANTQLSRCSELSGHAGSV